MTASHRPPLHEDPAIPSSNGSFCVSLSVSLWDWLKLIGTPVLVTGGIASLTYIANILIFRFLPPADAGLYAILLAASQTIALVAGLGQPSLLTRLYITAPLHHYDWLRDLVSTLGLLAPIILVSTFIVRHIYRLSFVYSVILSLLALGSLTAAFGSKIFHSQRHYTIGSLLLRLQNGLAILAIPLLPLFPASARLTFALVAQTLVVGVGVVIEFVLLLKMVPRGSAQIHLQERLQGLAFLAINFSAMFPTDGLLAVSGALITREHFASFAALFALFRPFLLVYNILNQVFLTELARRQAINYWRLIAGLWAGAGVLCVGSLIVLKPLAFLIYADQYTNSIFLIYWLALAMGLYMIEVLPRSNVIARCSTKVVNRFIGAQVLATLVGSGLSIYLIDIHGTLGIAQGMIVLFGLRSLVSYGFFAAI